MLVLYVQNPAFKYQMQQKKRSEGIEGTEKGKRKKEKDMKMRNQT